MAGTHYELQLGAQQKIRDLDLDGISDSNVIVRKLPVERGADPYGGMMPDEKPCVFISPMGTVGDRGGTNVRDDADYPVLISILGVDNQDLEANHDRYTTWNRRIRGRLHNQRVVDTLTESQAHNWVCFVRSGPTVSPVAFWKGIWHSSLLLRCIVRENRGAV